jgi:hypothetical protein
MKLVLSLLPAFNEVSGFITCADEKAPGHEKYVQLPLIYCPELPFYSHRQVAQKFLYQQCISPERLGDMNSVLLQDEIMNYIIVENEEGTDQLTVGMKSETREISRESVLDGWVRMENADLASQGVAVFEKVMNRMRRILAQDESALMPSNEDIIEFLESSTDKVEAEYFPNGNYCLTLVAYEDLMLVHATQSCEERGILALM